MSDTVDSSDNSAAGKCPVDLKTRSLWSLLGVGSGKPKNVMTEETTVSPTKNPSSSIPASLEEAAKHAQTPLPGQRLPLSTHRLESTIPRSSTRKDNNATLPAHQIRADASKTNDENDSSSDTWIYPSEQQVFNAMKRKGWSGIEEESIPSFLQIHNSVNERSWKAVQDSEGTTDIELSRFEGRPTDLTPKAWLMSTLGLRPKPFDRHDWYVIHKGDDGENEKRYVLDFYMTDGDEIASRGGMMPRVDIDVRPALDSPAAFLQRGTGFLREAFPGISREYDSYCRR